eukprot:GHVS01045738.1.p1 GENE.GHVS01045738.1~~GHVS01045738.1.p1  ORF type:complete len:422 (+),score=66.38 GHVS01045738.1:36-1268(+)
MSTSASSSPDAKQSSPPPTTEVSAGDLYQDYLHYLGSPLLSSLQTSLAELSIGVSPACGHLSYLESTSSSASHLPSSSAHPGPLVPPVVTNLLRRVDLMLCVRHGETPGNEVGVFQGRSNEDPLNSLSDRGREQAVKGGEELMLRLREDAGVDERSESCYMDERSGHIEYCGKRLLVFSSPSRRAFDTAATFIDQLRNKAGTTGSLPTSPSLCSSSSHSPAGSSPVATSDRQEVGAAAQRWICCLPSLLECAFGVLENRYGEDATHVVKYYDHYKRMYFCHNSLAKPIGPFVREHAHNGDIPCECFCDVILRGFEALKNISESVDKSLRQSSCGGKKKDVVVVLFAHSLTGHALRILMRKPIPNDSCSTSPPSYPEPVHCDGAACGCKEVMRFSGKFKLPNAWPFELWRA